MSLFHNPHTGPIPVHGGPRRLRDSFRSLNHRNFRRFQITHFFLHTAAWMFRIAVDWIALEITGEIATVGLLVFIQWAPIIVLGPYGAMIADRYSKRHTVAVAYSLFAVLAAVLAATVLAGGVQLWHIIVIALVVGLIYVVEIPARAVLLSEMVPHDHLQNAISSYAIFFWAGGIVGSLVGGLAIAVFGSGWAIGAYAIACAGVAFTVATLRVSELRVVPSAASTKSQFRATLRYARSKPTILWPLVLIVFFAVFMLPAGVMLSGMAKVVYQSGAAGYGLYTSMLAVGALLGALLSTRVRALRLRTVVVAGLVFAVLQATAGLVSWSPLFLALLVGGGCLRLIYEVVSDSLVQLSSNSLVRGRIVSLYVSVVAGGQAVGGPLLGLLADQIGPRMAMVISGSVPLLAVIVVCLIVARHSIFTRPFRLRRARVGFGQRSRESERKEEPFDENPEPR